MRLRPIVLGLLVVLCNCATLESLPANTCGNGVVDAAVEDCDSFPAGQCGQPGDAQTQCRLLCRVREADGKDKTFACPEGWGCGVDSVCREPLGTFDGASERLSVGSTTLLVGDFDGDGRKDIFGTSAFGTTSGKGRFHYFGDRGALVQTVALPAVITSPLVRDFDGTVEGFKADDLGFAYALRGAGFTTGGFAVLLGQADRAIVPKLFPSFVVPAFDGVAIPLDVPSQGPPHLLLIGRGSFPPGAPLINGIVSTQKDAATKQEYGNLLPGPAAKLAGVPVTKRIFAKDPTSGCGEVVVALNAADGPHVVVYSPCSSAPGAPVVWARGRPGVEIALPSGIGRVRGVLVADVNEDDDLDVLISVGEGRVLVSHGNGVSLGVAQRPDEFTPPDPAFGELPLAAADINGDRLTDYVLPSGVAIRRPARLPDGGVLEDPDGGGSIPGDGFYLIPAPSKRWSVAVIDDVNRDGRLDVIGASSTEPDLDVLEGSDFATGLSMPAFSLTTNGTVQHLLTIDLDLDGTKDVAFIEQRGTRNEFDVAVAYSRPFTMPPEAARTVGRATDVIQLVDLGQSMAIGTSTPSLVAGELPSAAVSLFFASGERQPLAPLLLNAGLELESRTKSADVERQWVPRAVAAGVFENKDRVDFVALAEGSLDRGPTTVAESSFGIWRAKGTSAPSREAGAPAVWTGFEPAREEIQLREIENIARPAEFQLTVQTRVVDIDGDGASELVAVSPNDLSSAAVRVIRLKTSQATPAAPIVIPDRMVTPNGRTDLVDIDGDGRLDLLALLRGPDGGLGLNIFYNDGAGGFVVPGTLVSLPPLEPGKRDDANVVGFAMVKTASAAAAAGRAPRPARKLAILTSKRLFVAPLPPARMPFGVGVEALVKVSSLGNGTDVATGDFDGDGIEDIAVADSGSIRILLQQSRLR